MRTPTIELGMSSGSTRDVSTRIATDVPWSRPARTFEPTPRAGDRVGRYVVVHELGRGGMGTVLRAHDPELARDIAVKLLRRRAEELPDGVERLLREARSMALLADPHVIQVFEAGVDAGRVFIAMELVDGEDLRAWLRTPRSVAEVLAVFEQAGRGLLAAHRAGLLHRDFKPDNILIGRDPQGDHANARVRVGDFGLAQLLVGASSSEPGESSQRTNGTLDSSNRLTRTGTVIGTPLYMAPEQHLQGTIDARADQFAFCVALYEALWRQLPHAGRNTDELARAKLSGPREPPRDPHVPLAIRRAVLKGLAARPDDRHHDMQALLGALARPQRSAARILGLSAACASVLALATAGASSSDPRCHDGARRLDGVWDASTRDTIRVAFVEDERPHTRETWQRLATALDEWTADWVAVHGQSCTAALAEDGEGEGARVLDARVVCLENARAELAALVDLLRTADDDVVLRSVRAVGALPPPSWCLDPAALDGDATSRHADVNAALARVRALAHAGRYGDAWLEIERISDRSDVATDPALHAEVGLWLGRMRHRTGAFAAAERALVDAYFDAQRAERMQLAAEAAVALVGVIGEAHSDAHDADVWARHAEAALAGLERPDPRTEAALHRGVGNLAMRVGDYGGAREETEAGLRVLVAALGNDHIDVGDFHNNLGNVAFTEGRYDEAIALHERALAIRRAHMGDHHPSVGDSYNNLGAAAFNVGRYDESKRYHEQSLAISLAAFGEHHADVAASHNNLGGVEQALGHNSEAIAHYREALAIWSDVLPADHPDVAYAHNNLGNALLAEKRYDEAAQAYERALAVREHVLGPDHRDVAVTLGNLAVADMAADNLDRARAELERAIAVFERELGPEHPDLATLLDNLGIVARRRGDPKLAISIHERALRIHLASLGRDHPQVATTEYGLGMALQAAGDRRAISHLQRACDGTPTDLPDLLREREGVLATARRELSSGS